MELFRLYLFLLIFLSCDTYFIIESNLKLVGYGLLLLLVLVSGNYSICTLMSVMYCISIGYLTDFKILFMVYMHIVDDY